MENLLGLRLESSELSDYMERASLYFGDRETMGQAIGKSHCSVMRFLEPDNEVTVVSLEAVERLLNIFNRSEPVVDIKRDLEEVIIPNDNYRITNVDLPGRFQKFLFQPYKPKELGEVAGVDRSAGSRYRSGDKRPPEELVEKCIGDHKATMDGETNIGGDIVYKAGWNRQLGDKALINSEAGNEEIREARKAEIEFQNFRNTEGKPFNSVLNNYDDFETIVELSKDPMRSYIKRGDLESSSGQFYHSMDELGVLEKWGGQHSMYEITASEIYLDTLHALYERAR